MIMYYKLSCFYKRDVFFFYSDENGYDRRELEKGNRCQIKGNLIYVVDKFDTYLSAYDILPTVGPPLVSAKFKEIIEQHCENDCVFIPVEIKSTETKEHNNDFFVMIVSNSVVCLNKEKSEYKPSIKSIPDGPISINYVVYIPDSLGVHHIVRMEESKHLIIVDEVFVNLCKENKVNGVTFIKEGSLQRPEYL